MSRIRIDGSRAVVTGAGSGIGAATALRLARARAEVIAVDIDGEAAESTAAACVELGASAGAYTCDVADSEAVGALAEQLETERGGVELLVNNAGVGLAGPFLDSTLEDWEWLRGVNLDGVVHGCHAFGAGMVRRGHGHIVNVASGAGYIANRNMAAYCASKAAVIMLSQCLRADWSGSGVGVSAICPGVIKTPIPTRTRMVGKMAGKQAAAQRAFRFGHSPDLVADAIVAAVEHDRDVVPVGIESALAFRILRFAPGRLQGLVARAQVL
jgi:2-hydroxycyclohexanecarboxyl-CoA dehydrogenase